MPHCRVAPVSAGMTRGKGDPGKVLLAPDPAHAARRSLLGSRPEPVRMVVGGLPHALPAQSALCCANDLQRIAEKVKIAHAERLRYLHRANQGQPFRVGVRACAQVVEQVHCTANHHSGLDRARIRPAASIEKHLHTASVHHFSLLQARSMAGIEGELQEIQMNCCEDA